VPKKNNPSIILSPKPALKKLIKDEETGAVV
jgi:hypothetical protein